SHNFFSPQTLSACINSSSKSSIANPPSEFRAVGVNSDIKQHFSKLQGLVVSIPSKIHADALDPRILCNKISKKKESKPRQFQDLFALMNQTGQTLFIY
ncbi:MAG: hypothetical protein EAZ61_13685, partial [Oscillatoriales cyanobacterium]